MYTSQESKILVKYGCAKNVCFYNYHVEEIALKKLSKSSNNKSMSIVDVKIVNVNFMP
jgi:hypothetical protein